MSILNFAGSKIKDAWKQASAQEIAHDERAALTKSVSEKAHDVRQKIAEMEQRIRTAYADRPLLAQQFATGAITEEEFEIQYPDGAAYRHKLCAYNEMLTALEKERKASASAQSLLKHDLNEARKKAWNLVAQAEVLEIMPGLVRAYAAYCGGNPCSPTTFAHDMLADSFTQYEQDIYRLQEKMRKDYTK